LNEGPSKEGRGKPDAKNFAEKLDEAEKPVIMVGSLQANEATACIAL
jgi:thiamine pyrophosphate-dependent acetolactate synthase large subunit-like protein